MTNPPTRLQKPTRWLSVCPLCGASIPQGTTDVIWFKKQIYCRTHTEDEVEHPKKKTKCFQCKQPIVVQRCWNPHFCSEKCLIECMPIYGTEKSRGGVV
jgi:hypothetical protein